MHPVRLVVLASGMGSGCVPRPARSLLLSWGVSASSSVLSRAPGGGIDEVVVVTGHRADQIDRHVLEVSRRRGIAVTVMRNERYREGNGLSALAARDGGRL